MSQKLIAIPASLVPKFEAWGEMTVQLFRELRSEAGLKPAMIPEDQAWFWTDEHQAKERLVDEEFKHGDYVVFDNADDLIKDLHAHV